MEELANTLIAGLQAQLPETGFRLDGIEVRLGALVDVQPDSLKEAIQKLLPGVEVRIQLVEALLRCEDCGAEYPADEHPCPVCGSPNARLIHGSELEIARAWGETV
jgi:Zn finger protein HypA/HybF involved in hydrogenase expression